MIYLPVKHSAGIILLRKNGGDLELLLGHMGGPFWARKDNHAWTIPKGEFDIDLELPAQAASREFVEETGMAVTSNLRALPIIKGSGKILHFFTAEGNANPKTLKSNVFELEWPPKSGQMKSFPELDKFHWFTIEEAKQKLVKGQMRVLGYLDKDQNTSDT